MSFANEAAKLLTNKYFLYFIAFLAGSNVIGLFNCIAIASASCDLSCKKLTIVPLTSLARRIFEV